MDLSGKNSISGEMSREAGKTFSANNPATGQQLDPSFYEASQGEIDRALVLAEKAFEDYRKAAPEKTAQFLERIADEIVALGDELIQRANAETALPEARLVGERLRTVTQLK